MILGAFEFSSLKGSIGRIHSSARKLRIAGLCIFGNQGEQGVG